MGRMRSRTTGITYHEHRGPSSQPVLPPQRPRETNTKILRTSLPSTTRGAGQEWTACGAKDVVHQTGFLNLKRAVHRLSV